MVTSKTEKRLGAGEFKAKCLRIMDEVAASRRAVVVTKKGKPVVRVVPVESESTLDVFGCMAGEIEIVGDIEAPVVAASKWKALR
ncbi:MAG TPA: type II toxin-antitoxin system prevent-host-death family antitoxin [Polyangiales bacterium]|jgi:prevent-host-death family protein|nr:type II toxin-antitoxin system prevent-host-death family antitoxin [Polyangiales bacterium]